MRPHWEVDGMAWRSEHETVHDILAEEISYIPNYLRPPTTKEGVQYSPDGTITYDISANSIEIFSTTGRLHLSQTSYTESGTAYADGVVHEWEGIRYSSIATVNVNCLETKIDLAAKGKVAMTILQLAHKSEEKV